MLVWLANVAFASSVLLRVGIPFEAGDVWGIAADGAAGQCSIGPSAIECPAEGPVTFRWGSPDWVLSGDVVLEPGQQGQAFLWAPEDPRRALLDPATVTDATVRTLFEVSEDNHQPPVPSAGMMHDLVALSDHPDPWVRIAAVDAWSRWTWRNGAGPLPLTAPMPLPPGMLTKWSEDESKGVRRRAARILREIRPSPLGDEAEAAIERLLSDPIRGVRRASYATLMRTPEGEILPVEQAWQRALDGLPQEMGPGRMSAATLAYLAGETGPTEVVDPTEAVRLTLRYHPESAWKVWTAWRDEVPLNAEWATILFRQTIGFSPELVQHWAATQPHALASVLERWESLPPHSERFRLVARWLAEVEHPSVRRALGLE